MPSSQRVGFLAARPPSPVRVLAFLVSFLLALAGLITMAGPSQAADATPISPGEAFTVQISGFFNTSSFAFEGKAGERVTLTTTGTGSSGYQYSVAGPDGALKAQLIDGYGELGVLPSTGSYTLTARNVGTLSSSIRATLNLVTDASGALALNTPTTATFDRPGRNYKYTFDAVAGEKLAVDISAIQLSDIYRAGVHVSVLRPGETDPGDAMPQYGETGPTLLDWTLDTTGTWTLKFDPTFNTTGSLTFTATKPVDQVLATSPGTATKITYVGGGQNVRLTFPAHTGERLTVKVSASDLVSPTGSSPDPAVTTTLLRPDGTSPGGTGDLSTAPEFTEALNTLDVTGTWTLLLDPPGDTQGSQTVTVSLVRDTGGSLKVGQSKNLTFTTPGQNASYTFQGKAGQTLIAELSEIHLTAGTSGTIPNDPGLTVTLLDPDGNDLTKLLTPNEQTYGEVPLAATGRYTLLVDPYGPTVGSAALGLRYSTTTTSKLKLGEAITARISRGDQVRYTFKGVADRRLNVNVTGIGLTASDQAGTTMISVYRPDGSYYVGTPGPIGAAQPLDSAPLDVSGTWSIVIDPQGQSEGTVTFAASLSAL